MKMLLRSLNLAELLSAFIRKGGWLFAPLGGFALLYLLQDKLVFNPARTPPAIHRSNATHRARAVTLSMHDGARLRGWWMRPVRTCPIRCPVLIYFGGRSEEVSWVSEHAVPGVHTLLVNYRGYGDSDGKPSESKLLADALELYDWISGQAGVDPDRITVIGRSLGTGIATYLATQRPVSAVVLITPYDSIVEIARRRFPYCAARLLLKHRFDSIRIAAAARPPVLGLLADQDEVVPKHHALRLFDAWAGPRQIITISSTNHCDIQLHPATWQAIRDFVCSPASVDA